MRLATHARSAGARVVTGRCYESEGAPAFWPWTQVLRGCLEGSPNPAPPSLAGLLPELAEPGQATHETSPEEARFGLFAAAARLLSETAREQPLVIGLEDLHWADVSSLLLLDFVVRELSAEPLLIVVTCREVELALTHPLVQTLGEIHGVRFPGIHTKPTFRGARREPFLQCGEGMFPPGARCVTKVTPFITNFVWSA